MKSIDIFTVWEKSNTDNIDELDLSPEKIRQILKPRISKSLLSVRINIITYLIAQFVSIILLSYNLSVFRNNDTLLLLTAGMLAASIFFFFYGIRTLNKLNKSDYIFKDLLDSVQKKLRILKVNVELWLWFCSASLVILILALNMMTDNVEGTYRINNILLFCSILVFVFFFIYGLNKFSLMMTVRRYKDFYTDLLNNALDRFEARQNWLRKYRPWLIAGLIVIFILLLIMVIKGIVMAY